MKKLSALGCLLLPIALSAACGRGRETSYEARGTVEVPEVDLAALTTGKVLSVRVEEGDQVRAGDTLAILGQIDLDALLAAGQAQVAAAQATLGDLEAGARPQEVRQLEAALAAAEAELVRTGSVLERARSLVADQAIARQQYDDAVAANRAAEERVAAAREALGLARSGSRPHQIQAARAGVGNARAGLAQVHARAGTLVLIAPASGIVLGRHAEPGELLGPNIPVLTIGETSRPYVRVYLPQSLVTGLAVGSEATVVPEGGLPIRARIAAINPKAEFTPRVALSEQERADLMFGVRVGFVNPAEAPHPGLWVVVRIGRSDGRAGGRTDSAR